MYGLILNESRTQEDIYEGMNEARLPVKRTLEKTLRAMVSRELKAPSSVLEIGAGEGYLRKVINPTYEWLELEQYEQVTQRKSLVQGDAKQIPFADNRFDCVVGFESFNAFTYEDLEGALSESMRVLKPGGTFLAFHDFSIGHSLMQKFLASYSPVRNFIRVGGKLPVCEYWTLPEDKKEAYKAALAKLEQEHGFFGAGELERELMKEYWQPIFHEEIVSQFHDHIRSRLEEHCDTSYSNVEVANEVVPMERGQDFLNFHGSYFPDTHLIEDGKLTFQHILKAALRLKFPAREIVAIPYTVGVKRIA